MTFEQEMAMQKHLDRAFEHKDTNCFACYAYLERRFYPMQYQGVQVYLCPYCFKRWKKLHPKGADNG